MPTGSSGHTKLRKARFAGTLAGIFTGFALVTPAKDFYLEKLGAHPITMGVLFFIISFCAPFNEMLSGRLQNKEALERFFPVAVWGRKAPWLFTHTIVLAVASGAMYIPPSREPAVLHAWFFVISIIMYWAISTTVIAFESMRQELYPYNEERAEVETLCKFACALGIGYACLPLLVLVAESSFWLRLGASAFFVVGVLGLTLQAKPVWLEAKSTSQQETTSLRESLNQTWNNVAFRHLVGARLGDGMYQGVQTTNLWYYLTYILQLSGVQRSIWVVGVGLCNLVGDMAIALIVGRLMIHRKNSFRIQGAVVLMRTVNVFFTVAFLVFPLVFVGNGPHLSSHSLLLERVVFLVWTTVNRICQSPFTFWRVGAQCWVIDEDIQEGNGARREAAFIGVASATQNFSRALAGAICFLGYGIAGLAPRDCDSECKGLTDCFDPCMDQSIMSQPTQLRWYIRMLYIVGLVICEATIVYHMALFPIRGTRLAKLYNKQTLAYGGDIDSGSPVMQMRKLHRKNSPTLQQIVDAQHGTSIVVMASDDGAGVSHVHQMLSHKRMLSASVIFSPHLACLRESAASVQLSEGGQAEVGAEGNSQPMPMPAGTPAADCNNSRTMPPLPEAWAIGNEHDELARPSVFPADMGRCAAYLQPTAPPPSPPAASAAYLCNPGGLGGLAAGNAGPRDAAPRDAAPRDPGPRVAGAAIRPPPEAVSV